MSAILESRRIQKAEDDAYRAEAARVSGGTVTPFATVNRNASNDGAFVEVTVWVPRLAIPKFHGRIEDTSETLERVSGGEVARALGAAEVWPCSFGHHQHASRAEAVECARARR